jgi:hypothetical protein
MDHRRIATGYGEPYDDSVWPARRGSTACRARGGRRRGGPVSASGDDGLGCRGLLVVRVMSTSVKQVPGHDAQGPALREEPRAIRWHKRQYRYREEACPRGAFTESIAEIPLGVGDPAGGAVGSPVK